jgi:hypothetical protein
MLLKWLAGVLSELCVDRRVRVAGGDVGVTWIMEPSELSRGVGRYKSHLPGTPIVGIFCTGKI